MLSDDVLRANIAFSNIFISGFNNSWDEYVRYVGIFLLVTGWYRFYKLLVEWPGIAREIKKSNFEEKSFKFEKINYFILAVWPAKASI